MSPSPDPDESQEKLREIFNKAAAKSTGPGKPYFERISNSFNACEDAAKAGDLPGAQRAKQDFTEAMADVQIFAKTDHDTAVILLEVAKAIIEVSGEKSIEPPKKKKSGKRWEF